MAQASTPTKPAPAAKPIEEAPVVCPMPTPPPAVEDPNEPVLVLLDSKGLSEVNAERVGFSLLREGTMVGQSTQQLSENHYLEQGLNEVTLEVWRAIEACQLKYIRRAIDLGNIERLPDWKDMDVRKKVTTIELCLDSKALPWLKTWKDTPGNSAAVEEALDKKINELVGLTPDQFAAMRQLLGK